MNSKPGLISVCRPAGRFGRRFAPLAALTSALLLLAPVAGALELRVEFDDGRRSQRLPLDRLQPDSDEWYVSANLLAPALDLERFWKPEARKIVFKVEGMRVQATVDTRLVLQGEDEVLLRAPVLYRDGAVMLPLEFVDRVLGAMMGIELDRANLRLRVGRGRNDIEALEFVQLGGDTQVHVRMNRRFRYRVETGAEVVRLRIYGAAVDPVALARETPAPMIQLVRAEQLDDEAVLYIELDQRPDGVDERSVDDGSTVVLTLRRPLAPTPRPEFKLPGQTPAVTETQGCRHIILDAGHGGFDTGVRAAGLTEKDVTLELARKLAGILERRFDLKVELLRQNDRAYTADRRAELANKSNGDMLISLHCNGWFDASARGFEVLFVGPEALAQPAVSLSEARREFRRWDDAQQPYAARSQALAQLLQIEMGRQLPLDNRGAREVQVEFLRGLSMPAVMIEVGFLTNPQEAALIADPTFPEALAVAVGTAVQRFCDQFSDDGARTGSRD